MISFCFLSMHIYMYTHTYTICKYMEENNYTKTNKMIKILNKQKNTYTDTYAYMYIYAYI